MKLIATVLAVLSLFIVYSPPATAQDEDCWHYEDGDAPVVGSVDTPDYASGVAVAGAYAYVADVESGLQVIDISVPESPAIVGAVDTPGEARRVAVAGNYAYVADGGSGLQIAWGQCAETIVVDIDIKPGSDSNSINCKGNNGVVPVAILTTEDFDALTIDHQTVLFGPDGAGVAHVKGPHRSPHNGEIAIRPNAGEVKRHEEDVDGDGDMDLLFHFRYSETGIQCGDTEVTLTGETYDGQAVTGTDEIRTVPTNDEPTSTEMVTAVFPNPFNPQTTIAFDLPQRVAVSLHIFDIAGRLVKELINAEELSPGRHEVVWNGRDDAGRQVASGTYFYRLEAGSYSETKRMVLIK
jgi:hypothetical protein